MKHLNDFELQAFLDNEPLQQRGETARHLAECAACRKQLEAYRIVYSTLQTEPAFALHANFKETVLTRIRAETAQLKQSLEWLIFAVAALFSLCMAVFLVGVETFKKFATTLFSDFSGVTAKIAALFEGFGIFSPENFSFILMAAVVLIFTTLIDRFLFSRLFRQKYGDI